MMLYIPLHARTRQPAFYTPVKFASRSPYCFLISAISLDILLININFVITTCLKLLSEE